MKIIFLNVWNAKLAEPLTEFIAREAEDTDIFCFQETFDEALALLTELLPGYGVQKYRRRTDAGKEFAIAVYTRPEIKVKDSGVLLEDGVGGGYAQWILLETEQGSLYVANVHGVPWPGEKLDTPARIHASETLITHAALFDCSKIIGGDFNLHETSQSVRMFSENGYRDLISAFNIDTTRNKYAWASYPHPLYYSDYVFVQGDVEIHSFSVPKNEVSDHLPLILTIV